MRSVLVFFGGVSIFFSVSIQTSGQQTAPNDANDAPSSGTSMVAGKLAATPVNLYTGLPTVSIPIYQYSHHNGLHLNISLDYFTGGVKVNESATITGMNWYLNAGGVITRNIRGMPDELTGLGYHYTGALPADPSFKAHAYYQDSLDAEMDIFQYNFNGRSGKFCIGKNGKVFMIPLSKMKVSYDTSTGYDGSIIRFTIKAEDGVKYVFSDVEMITNSSDPFKSGYGGDWIYARTWYLSQIIAPFNTDTIKFNYNTYLDTITIRYPQSVYVLNSNTSNIQQYAPVGKQTFFRKKLTGINFPDKKSLRLIYSDSVRYGARGDSALSKIVIWDTIFRNGFFLNWSSSYGDPYGRTAYFLGGIQKYTQNARYPQYRFTYNPTLFPFGPNDTAVNSRDHWGYYNGAQNGLNAIPTISGVYSGANRDPSSAAAISSSLSSITDPSGGITYYQFESNDLPKYSNMGASITVDAMKNSQDTISLYRVLGDWNTIFLASDINYGSNGSITGNCNLVCSVTSLDGTVTYGSISTTLYAVSAKQVSFSFHAPNGRYLLKRTISNCSTGNPSIPIDIFWQNQIRSVTDKSMTSGGIRLKQQSHYDPLTGRIDTLASYRYIYPDSNSSGFLGPVPVYSYPFQQTVINGSTVTSKYTVISSDPVNNLDYTQGSPVGYGRVEVLKGSFSHNLGKEVYEFRNLSDANANQLAPFFPYVPSSQRDWILGLPKRVSVYDSSGKLVSVTSNTYLDSLYTDSTVNFQSRKFGKISTTFYGNPSLPSTNSIDSFTTQEYYPETGYAFLVQSVDSFFHTDNSVQVVQKSYQYDSNFNVVKMTSPYDLSRGLTLERRLYYPYNYTLGGGIGKLRDSGLIAVLVSSEDWITGDANPRMIGSQAVDFVQLPKGHVKPSIQYSLQANSPLNQAVIGAFAPGTLVRSAQYLPAQLRFTSYDSTGNLLVTQNAQSGVRNAAVMDYSNQYVVARVTNADSVDIAYTSFESDGSGSWTIGSVSRTGTAALTGKQSYNLSSGNITRSGLNTSQTYLISAWAYTGASVSVNGSLLNSSIAQQNNWSLYQTTITGVASVTISGSGLIDELRLHPKDANMTTSTFEPMLGVTSTCDANNTVTYSNYDLLNRLQFIRDKDLNILKKYEYSDSIILIKPNWQNTGVTKCDSLVTGQIDRQQRDINPDSYTYNTTRFVPDHVDCLTCIPKCPPGSMAVGCNCETGTRVNLSSSYDASKGKWLCVWVLCYSNGTTSQNNYEYNSTKCTITPGGCSL